MAFGCITQLFHQAQVDRCPNSPEFEVFRPQISGGIQRRFAFAKAPVNTTGLVAFDVALVNLFNRSAVWQDGVKGAETFVTFGADFVTTSTLPGVEGAW